MNGEGTGSVSVPAKYRRGDHRLRMLAPIWVRDSSGGNLRDKSGLPGPTIPVVCYIVERKFAAE